MAGKGIAGFGKELKDIPTTGGLDWWISFQDPRELWKAQPTYLLSEYAYYIVGLLTFVHAHRVGGRFKYLWWAIMLHGLATENMSFWVPNIDNYWHSQTTVMTLGRHLPLHIFFLYPAFIYCASVAVSRMKLPSIAEACAVGLGAVLIDMPYDIVSVKYVHWTWHDTDPNIYDRHYWVPWNSYYFHATFAASFTFFFHFWRRKLANSPDKWTPSKSVTKELLCTLLAAVSGIPGGILLFVVLYHPLHDFYNVHSESTFVTLAVIYLLIIWAADRNPTTGSRPSGRARNCFNEIALSVLLLHTLFFLIPFFFNPEEEVSVGLHETVGPCKEYVSLNNAMGIPLKRRKFLCPTDYNEDYYDFHCVPKGKIPADYTKWYTICGTPFKNRVEYILTVGTVCIISFTVFRQLLFKSGSAKTVVQPASKSKKTK